MILQIKHTHSLGNDKCVGKQKPLLLTLLRHRRGLLAGLSNSRGQMCGEMAFCHLFLFNFSVFVNVEVMRDKAQKNRKGC